MNQTEFSRASERFVEPFYQQMLHGNCLDLEAGALAQWTNRLHRAANDLTEDTAALLLGGPSWREHVAVSWFIGMRGWRTFVGRLGDLLLTERPYEGQGFSVGLAALATSDSADALVRYLDHGLNQLDRRFDQAWAMAALIEIDRQRGSGDAERFLGETGPWMRWSVARPAHPTRLAPVREILDLIAFDPPAPASAAK